MLTSLFDSTTIPVLEHVVDFTEARHGVLAGNIANIDTPGYRTRDLSPEMFRERLQKAIETRHAPHSPGYDTASSYSATQKSLDPFEEVDDSLKGILYHDESDVSLEREVTEITKNQMEHDLAVSIMAAQFRLLRAAITERLA